MLNEGVVINDSKTLVKSEILRHLWRLRRTTPDQLERAVFEALTGGSREDIDWDFEDNKAGYFQWAKSFDGLISELVEDDYILIEKEGDRNVLAAARKEPEIEISQLVYPSAAEK